MTRFILLATISCAATSQAIKIYSHDASRAAKIFTPLQLSLFRPVVVVTELLNQFPEKVAYSLAWDFQKKLLVERTAALLQLPEKGAGRDETCPVHDALVLVEHEPVITLGTSALLEDVLFDSRPAREAPLLRDSLSLSSPPPPPPPSAMMPAAALQVVKVDRGGEATWHGPGQLVAYPILDLRRYMKDLHWYLRALEEVGIRASTAALLSALERKLVRKLERKRRGGGTFEAAYRSASDDDKESRTLNARLSHSKAAAKLRCDWGVSFGRVPGYTGCWCVERPSPRAAPTFPSSKEHPSSPNSRLPPVKVMATGVSVKRWITMHGLALNCDCDLSWAAAPAAPADADGADGLSVTPFVKTCQGGHSSDSSSPPGEQVPKIVPCGVRDKGVGSLTTVVEEAWSCFLAQQQHEGCSSMKQGEGEEEEEKEVPITVMDVRPHLVQAFEDVFGCSCRSEVPGKFFVGG